MASLLPVLGYSAIPVLAATIGAAATVWRKPGGQVTSIVQHFAAGVVFAAAAGELLPDMLHDKGAVTPVILGAAAGVALMLAIRAVSKRVGESAGQIAVTGIDVLIDGFVVSLGFIAGAGQGLLLTVALSIELLFLGLTVALALGNAGGSGMRVVLATAGVALLLPLGAAAGMVLFQGLAQAWLTGFFAFGLVALLYLVTEELLVEAHEKDDTPVATAVFFVGFFLLILLDEAIR